MPVNEIQAPSYIKIFYRNPTVNHQHVQRWYFTEPITISGDNGFGWSAYTDEDHLEGWLVSEVVAELFSRAVLANGNLPPYQVDKVEVWAGEAGANEFLGYDNGDYDDVDGGSGSPNASAYELKVFETATKLQFRATFFENGVASPQRYAQTPPPEEDDTFFNWFILRSAVEFANNDGVRLTLAISNNTGYNRKLARTYGRDIMP